MFTQLLASRPVRQRSTAGLVGSIALHTAIAAGVVYATMRVAPVAAAVVTQRVTYVPQTEPEPQPPAPAPSVPTTPVVSDWTGPVINVPTIAPTTLPPITTGSLPVPSDFAPGTRFIPGGTPSTGGITAPPAGTAYVADQVDVVVAIAKGSPMPSYPSALRSTGIDGSARFRFVVDSTGRVEVNTVEQVLASHEAFGFAVRATLSRMRFTPAQVNGKTVRQLVELPFVFRVDR
jgi:TonB family protein